MADAHKNFSYSTVLTAPSPATSGTSVVLASGGGALMPAVPFNATIWPTGSSPLSSNAEIVRVTAIASDTLTITRSQESSSARTVVVGDQFAATVTKKTLEDIETVASAAAPGLNPTAVKTANYTAAANEFVPVDTTSGAVTITLPSAPANGTRFGVKLVTQGGTNGITITRGGTDVFNKTGGNTSVTVTLLNQSVQFQYSSGIWYGVAADIGLTALDARYTTQAYVDAHSALKLPTYTVGASGADYTTIAAAMTAAASTGGTIYLSDASYTITSGLTFGGSNIVLQGNGTTIIQGDAASVTTFLKSASTSYTHNTVRGIVFTNTNATVQGIGLDASNMALCTYQDLVFNNFGKAMVFNDTANLTFYNMTERVWINNCNNGVEIAGTTPSNSNTFVRLRINLRAGGAGIGLKMTKGQSNSFYDCDFEPGTGAGITGVSLVPAANGDVSDTNFYGIYCESNDTNVSINSNTQRTNFFGGKIVAAITTDLSDAGKDSQFFGTDINYIATSQYTQGTWTDSSNASQTFNYINNTSFAHASSNLIKVKLRNGTDSSNVLRIENSGSGNNISSANGTSETFSVDKAGAILSGGVSVPTISSISTLTNKRITSRINTTTSSATPAINTDTTDQFNITALAVAITSMTSGLTGTPTDGQKLFIRITGDATPRAITWGTSFQSSGTATLLATTAASKTHEIGLKYNSTAAKWVCIAVDVTGY